MAIPATISSEQTTQVGVNGPNDVANMHVVTGIANGQLNAFAPSGNFVYSRRRLGARRAAVDGRAIPQGDRIGSVYVAHLVGHWHIRPVGGDRRGCRLR